MIKPAWLVLGPITFLSCTCSPPLSTAAAIASVVAVGTIGYLHRTPFAFASIASMIGSTVDLIGCRLSLSLEVPMVSVSMRTIV